MPDHTDYDKYLNYQENDFISDPLFQDWIIKPDRDLDKYWSRFLNNNPARKQYVENARAFLMNLAFRQDIPDEQLIQRSLATHFKRIDVFEATQRAKVRKVYLFKNALRIAAVFGGVVLLVYNIFYFNRGSENVLVQTKYGNVKHLVLPDSSSIVLNANSKLEYNGKWKRNKIREVWLEGEAFFDVKHLNRDESRVKAGDHFIVHLKDLDIEVLGTSFNIRSRRGKTEVVLQTGKIKVSFRNKAADFLMKPDDILVYNHAESKIIRDTIVAQDYTAWKDRKLILHDPTISEVVQYLEDNFGKKIILEKKDFGARKIEGPILYNNLDDALFIISMVLQADVIKQDDNKIIIRPR